MPFPARFGMAVSSGPDAEELVQAVTGMPARRGQKPGARGSAARPGGRTGARTRTRVVPPILVRELRDGFEESVHRGDIVQVDAEGRVIRAIGDPGRPVLLRSAAHPFGVAALIEAGGLEAFELQPPEIALMAGTHSGEDLHVRTLQGVLRRATLSQALLDCGSDGMPLDTLTAARLARDGEKAGAVRHMCSGQHTVALLLCKLNGWETVGYWMPEHPAQVAIRVVVARVLGATPDQLPSSLDSCGLPTWGVPLRELARAYAFLAQPASVPASDPRASIGPAMALIRDAMLANPEMVGGSRDRLDTSLMKELPGRLVSRSSEEGVRAVAILPAGRGNSSRTEASGLVLKIEDGGANRRACWAATVEAVAQVGLLDPPALRALARYHRPVGRDSHGTVASEAVAGFDLVPVGELVP